MSKSRDVANSANLNSISGTRLVDLSIPGTKIEDTPTIPSSKLSTVQLPNQFSPVTRSVQSKLNDFVSVLDFGADPTGASDSTEAFKNAIDYCSRNRKTLYVPANGTTTSGSGREYRLTGPIECYSITGVLPDIVGDGIGNTSLRFEGLSAGQFCIDYDFPQATNYYLTLSEFNISTDNSLPGGIRLKNASYSNLNSVRVSNVKYGVLITGGNTFSNFTNNLICYNCTDYCVYFQDFSGGGHYNFLNSSFVASPVGVYMDPNSGVSQISFMACNFEVLSQAAIKCEGAMLGCSILSCRTEAGQGDDFVFAPTAGNTVAGLDISGCFFTGGTIALTPVVLGGGGGIVRGFTVSSNYVQYAACGTACTPNGQFVFLGSGVRSGSIFSNYLSNAQSNILTNTQLAGVVIYSNEYANGQFTDYWGTTPVPF